MKLQVVPLTVKELNAFVDVYHRHHKPVQGHKFSVGALYGDKLVGAASVGRPVARMTNHKEVLEVTRLVTDGTPNACSFLYGVTARVAKELGYRKIQTFILASEPGISLKAAGWVFELTSGGF